MQFQVPQFIEVEDKIFGPFTLKQFIFIIGGAGLSFVLWKQLPSFASLPLVIMVLSASGALAFMKYNDRPFIMGVENAFYFFFREKLYLWNSDKKKKSKKAVEAAIAQEQVRIPTLSDSKLHDLAWSLDIKEKVDQAHNRESTLVSRGLGGISGLTSARDARIR
jgi:hypothetical protein